ncbi:hypothetical protein V1525DRAFT_351301 [Lipomyces kononenkoae]|uniref:Uncharacterized protein n=1 Tax=Lipomyces kononenkoae TaxID=34357 RepID=A0ACC3SQD4_LIPKO
MSKLVVVVGATGGQGGSVVSALLQDKSFTIRGITRNPGSENAKKLAAQGVEIVAADLNDEDSLVKAFAGAYAIFAVTDFFEPFKKMDGHAAAEVEYQQGVNMATAASKTPSLQHYIWSTLPYSHKLSHGKVTVPHFDGKARVDEFIRKHSQLLAKTTFIYNGYFASNMLLGIFNPTFIKSSGKYVLLNPGDPEKTPIWSIGDHCTNIGIFVHSLLINPTKNGTYVLCSVDDFPTMTEFLAKWGASSGLAKSPQSTMVLQIPFEQYKTLWPKIGEEIGTMMIFWELLGNNSWAAPPGEKMVHARKLMTEAAQKKLVTTEETFKSLDWASVM